MNSYIRIPEDEKTIEDFGDTPYYIMARKEDQSLIDQLDKAIDRMNIETPNWRTELYNKYYGSEENNREFTEEEKALLEELQTGDEPIRAVMNPDMNPYSWYENGEARGIVADIFKETAQKLKISYEIVPVFAKEEYEEAIESGSVDIWMDLDSYYEVEREHKYKISNPYLTTTLSVLRERGASEKIGRLVTDDVHISVMEIISEIWPDAELTVVDSAEECSEMVVNGKADGALLRSYTAQRLAREDLQNRLRVDIVPGASLQLQMGINANISHNFFSLWKKALAEVAENSSAEIVQKYMEQTATPTMLEYMFDHPVILIVFFIGICFLLFLSLLYVQSVRSKRKQEKISGELTVALQKADEATKAKQEFFSKMSHDIRTPLNVVLGMTQIAQKYKDNAQKLDDALNNISEEGNYLLVLINFPRKILVQGLCIREPDLE